MPQALEFEYLYSHTVNAANPPLPWLEPGESFPPTQSAWGEDADVPGLLCAGGDLSVDSLQRAYRQAIFPWFSADQPILWWSPNPRMVLNVADFRLHPSFKKTLKKFSHSSHCDIRVDSAFDRVIALCSSSLRNGQAGTWIVPDMIAAYTGFHQAGFAHSMETWIDGQLVGGLYFVNIGRAVFGESMFHLVPDSSKIALAALVCMCRRFGIQYIDCQQNTRHLSSLGAQEMPRGLFAEHVNKTAAEPSPDWKFRSVYWGELITQPTQ